MCIELAALPRDTSRARRAAYGAARYSAWDGWRCCSRCCSRRRCCCCPQQCSSSSPAEIGISPAESASPPRRLLLLPSRCRRRTRSAGRTALQDGGRCRHGVIISGEARACLPPAEAAVGRGGRRARREGEPSYVLSVASGGGGAARRGGQRHAGGSMGVGGGGGGGTRAPQAGGRQDLLTATPHSPPSLTRRLAHWPRPPACLLSRCGSTAWAYPPKPRSVPPC